MNDQLSQKKNTGETTKHFGGVQLPYVVKP